MLLLCAGVYSSNRRLLSTTPFREIYACMYLTNEMFTLHAGVDQNLEVRTTNAAVFQLWRRTRRG